MNRKFWILSAFVLYILYMIYMATGCNNPENSAGTDADSILTEAHFVGEQQCQSCHETEHKDWMKSDHRLAMQPATDSSILGDFNNTSFVADGVTNKFFKKEGKFYINTQGDDGKNHDYEVLYAFGYFPLQQYLIAFPGGRMQSARVSWDSRNNKWFHQYPGQKVYHKDWLHWTGDSQNWNTMCASCHSTDLQKNYDFETDTYKTTWKDINVSCESCHGPGSTHIDFLKSKHYAEGKRLENSGFVYSGDSISQTQLNTCAPCHARKSDIAASRIHSGEILDDMIPQVINNEFYFADGQINAEDYEYGSFSQSKMFHNNVRCSNCHNPHSGKLKKIGNDLCLSCHKPSYDTEAHHFHKLNTESAKCVNCHMASKTYMGNDHRRDHSFRIPRPDQSLAYGTPNACNGCHKEKSAGWSADAVVKWYGPDRKYHFSDDLIPGSKLDSKSESHLIKLLNDTLQPEIARAAAAQYLGDIATPMSAGELMKAINDRKALVRYHALRSLGNFTSEIWQQNAYHCLSDKVRAVRIAAAGLYRRTSIDKIPLAHKSAYLAADAENLKFLQYQTDFSVGNVMLADYSIQGGAYLDAIKYYLRGLKKDSLMNYARLNLSAAYNSMGKNNEALKTLQDAAAIDPQNDQIFYNLGLLHYEMGDVSSAQNNFKKAINLKSQNPGLYYNFGILLQQLEQPGDAEKVLLRGFELDPRATNINYALAYFYVQQKKPEKARLHAKILHQVDPNNPDYQRLFNDLGL